MIIFTCNKQIQRCISLLFLESVCTSRARVVTGSLWLCFTVVSCLWRTADGFIVLLGPPVGETESRLRENGPAVAWTPHPPGSAYGHSVLCFTREPKQLVCWCHVSSKSFTRWDSPLSLFTASDSEKRLNELLVRANSVRFCSHKFCVVWTLKHMLDKMLSDLEWKAA